MLALYGESLSSRLLLGSAGYASPQQVLDALEVSAAEVMTFSLKREIPSNPQTSQFQKMLIDKVLYPLPNTAGCRSAKEAIQTAILARELFNTCWIKLEITCDDYSLHPHSVALLEATKELVAQGFKVFPYCTADMSVCDRLVTLGCEVLMPWGAPIGSGQGLQNLPAFKRLRARFHDVVLIIDAGIGAPSDACKVMELGADAVLINSAVSRAVEPVQMAAAMAAAVNAGRQAFKAGVMPQSELAVATTPVVDRPFWQQEHHKSS